MQGNRLRCCALASLLALGCAGPSRAGGADALLAPHEVRGWDVTGEAPVDPRGDPDLVEWGVRAQRVRHYARERAGWIEVCSVEVWRFHSEAQAAAAATGFRFPDWQIDAVGDAVVMVRGLVRRRDGTRPSRGVFPACDALGARVRARARAG